MNLLRFFLLSLLALSAQHLGAQTTSPDASKKEPGTIIDAAKRLLENKDSVSSETKKRAADAAKAALNQVPEDLQNKAKQMLADPKAAAARAQALQSLKAATPQKQPANAVPETVTSPPAPVGPQPRRLGPLALDDPQALRSTQSGQTVITATKTAFFDNEKGEGIYTGNLRVRSPQGSIDCDELEIHMPKQREAPAKKKPLPSDSDILAGGSRSSPLGVRPEIAYARGSMVTIEKRTAEGELQIAHCNEVAIYDGKTDKITLRGWPSVQQGGKIIEATDPRTYIIIDEKGKLSVEGGSARTTLVGENPSSGDSPVGTANETPPNTPAPAETPGSQQR